MLTARLYGFVILFFSYHGVCGPLGSKIKDSGNLSVTIEQALLKNASRLYQQGDYTAASQWLVTQQHGLDDGDLPARQAVHYLLLRCYEQLARGVLEAPRRCDDSFAAYLHKAEKELHRLQALAPDSPLCLWRGARLYILKYRFLQACGVSDLPVSQSGLQAQRHCLCDLLTNLSITRQWPCKNRYLLDSIQAIRASAGFSAFTRAPGFIIDVSITLAELWIIKAHHADTPFKSYCLGQQAMACLSKLYAYSKAMVASCNSSADYNYNDVYSEALFQLLGIRAGTLWAVWRIPCIGTDATLTCELQKLASIFYLDLNGAKDVFLAILYGHGCPASVKPTGIVSRFWLDLDARICEQAVRSRAQLIAHELEQACGQLEQVMSSELPAGSG